ncbi:hypothetical protein JDV02_009680 [Purpureocillium takamizusanense]|uniref:Uncharacterized protein n=1 Tax=Purpureocillium takamizusanense TaxID=2060973 RepID=A0A9Q8QQH2_9HYPO|nr:uncharacterized protein JDV02_009680 [Purpureocillium takamizusanense]UNI23888.1 hypothetical protein JDV02_009680 [Purpureocillium takamizusanense]
MGMRNLLAVPLILSRWGASVVAEQSGPATVTPMTDQALSLSVVQEIHRQLQRELPTGGHFDTPFITAEKYEVYAHECLSNRLDYLRRSITLEVEVNEGQLEVNEGSNPITFHKPAPTPKTDIPVKGWSFRKGSDLSKSALLRSSFNDFKLPLAVTGLNSTSEDPAQKGHILPQSWRTFVCPAQHACSVQTWTYLVRSHGHCTVVPIYHANCTNPLARVLTGGWGSSLKVPMEQIINNNQSIALAALKEAVATWDRAGSLYYSVSRKDGRSFIVPLPLIEHEGVWHPTPEQYNVQYRFDAPCHYSSMLRTQDGKVMSTQVLITRSLLDGNVKRGEVESGDDVEDLERRFNITVLEKMERLHT